MLSVACQLIVAYYVADLVAAVYHFATDYGWNTQRVVANFMKHHGKPGSMTFDLEPMLGGLPLMLTGLWLASPFVFAFGLFIGFAQVPHYYTHHPAPVFVQSLQRWGAILPPAEHEKHHSSGHYDRNFSVINGWSNPLLNWCLDKAGL